jgi:predicted branched-subunit amino acid permease
MHVFEKLLNPCYFECLEVFLVCQHVSLPIFSGKISFIFAKTIASKVYLGSWVLVTLVIDFRFLLNSCLFLLEAWGKLFELFPS